MSPRAHDYQALSLQASSAPLKENVISFPGTLGDCGWTANNIIMKKVAHSSIFSFPLKSRISRFKFVSKVPFQLK